MSWRSNSYQKSTWPQARSNQTSLAPSQETCLRKILRRTRILTTRVITSKHKMASLWQVL